SLLDGPAQQRRDSLLSEFQSDVDAAQPGPEVLSAGQVMRSKCSGANRSRALMRQPPNWELIATHVQLELRRPRIPRVLWRERTPVIEQARDQTRRKLERVCEIADLHLASVNLANRRA